MCSYNRGTWNEGIRRFIDEDEERDLKAAHDNMDAAEERGMTLGAYDIHKKRAKDRGLSVVEYEDFLSEASALGLTLPQYDKFIKDAKTSRKTPIWFLASLKFDLTKYTSYTPEPDED